MAWEAIVEHGLITVAIHVAERIRRLRFIRCRLMQRNRDMRVSFSALLRISNGGRYLLVRNLHRPETFGPFGGVYKYHGEALRTLDDFVFKPQDIGPDHDMEHDLRGFLPRRNLSRVVKWFEHTEDRETAAECLRREMLEELAEVGVDRKGKLPGTLSLRLVRRVEEGPEHVPGEHYTQFRMFEVYEPRSEQFARRLLIMAKSNEGLLAASAEEIAVGRATGNQIIGHHACYLIGRARLRAEDPPFARR